MGIDGLKAGVRQMGKDAGDIFSGRRDAMSVTRDRYADVKTAVGPLVSKTWERVKEGPVGMWVREKRANSLGRKIDKQQTRIDELGEMIQGAGGDHATTSKLMEEQMMRVGKINTYGAKRSEFSRKLGNYYHKKLEGPESKRKDIQTGLDDASSQKKVSEALKAKYTTAYERFQERQQKLLASRSYERSGEMASIAKSLSEMTRKMQELDQDIATKGSLIERAEKDLQAWDTKNNSNLAQRQRWTNVAFDGKHGTAAARRVETASTPKVRPIEAPRGPNPPEPPKAANDNLASGNPAEGARSPESQVSGEAVRAFLKEILGNDLRASLQGIVDKMSQKDVMNGAQGKGATQDFIDMWEQLAVKGKPTVESITGKGLQELKNHKGPVNLVEFGVLVFEKGGLDMEQVKRGVEKIAEKWNASLEKQKQAA
jgi:hypothetical protein